MDNLNNFYGLIKGKGGQSHENGDDGGEYVVVLLNDMGAWFAVVLLWWGGRRDKYIYLFIIGEKK